MKSVAEYIRTLLFEHDYVTVPNFGAFIANYVPSSHNDISGSIMPPQKKIAFNEILKQDDGLLATYISRRESMTVDEAKRTIQSFVAEVKFSLANQRAYNFGRIGSFSLNQENNLVFDPDRRSNFFSESFGFSSIFPHRIDKPSYTLSQTFDEDNLVHSDAYNSTEAHSRWTYVLYSLPVLLLSSGLLMVLFTNPKNDDNSARSSFNPMDYIPSRTEEVNKVEETANESGSEYDIIKPVFGPKEETKPEVKAIPEKIITPKVEPVEKKVEAPLETVETKTTINSTEKRYLIVSGIFKSKENVDRLSANLLRNGFSPKVVEYNGMMKVIAGEADSYDEAELIAGRHQQLIGEKPAIIRSK